MDQRIYGAALLAVTAVVAVAPPAAAATGYQKKAVAVYEPPSKPYMGVVAPALTSLSRFEFVHVAPAASLSDFLARVRAAGPGDAPVYVFVPDYRFGDIEWTKPEQSTTKYSTGQIKTVVHTDVKCPFIYTVRIYDARTGQVVHTLESNTDLTRRFEAEYDQRNSDREVGYKEGMLIARAEAEARKRPEEAFADLARKQAASLDNWLAGEVRRLPEFVLRASVTGWDAREDVVFLDMGKNFKVTINEGFKLVRDGRELGYMRVVRTGAEDSVVKPVFLDTMLRKGDQLVEYPKSNVNAALKAGVAWLGGPAFIGGLDLEGDIGPGFGSHDWFLGFDASGVKTQDVGGVMLEAGVVKKLFYRRYGLSLGLKPGWVGLGKANSFGLTALTGVTVYLTPDFQASVDLGWQAYTPVKQQGGANDGKYVNPMGPVIKGGLAVAF